MEDLPEKESSESPPPTPPAADPSDLLRMLTEATVHFGTSPKAQLDRLFGSAQNVDLPDYGSGIDVSAFNLPGEYPQFPEFSNVAALRNSTKTLKCPKCNWHYKYQETLEIHMKEKHSENEVKCQFCAENRPHPKLSRGESYSCGYKPYRCDLCRYSTTTKGNLSIHMQSDKHIHALQELSSPNNIVPCAPSTARSLVQEGEHTFVCLLCGNFSCGNLFEMMQHCEKDRSHPSQTDVSMSGGIFRCHLCPYHTNLKANFQLHTRTDKHIQRVQMVNHIREGGNTAGQAFARLGAAKSAFQVLCRPCQEIFPSSATLREHCDTVGHRTNLRQPIISYTCKLCSLETQHKQEALGHMACHEPSSWPKENIDFDAMTMEEDAAYACVSCGFTAKDASTLEEHARGHEEGEMCPLCNERAPTLPEHLIEKHAIAESAVEKLLQQVHRVEPTGSAPGYSFRCGQCSLAFRSESALHSHSLLHLFAQAMKCPHCAKVFSTSEEMKTHIDSEHAKSEQFRCELCNENYSSKSALFEHFNSVPHLHEAKKQLEQGAVSLNSQVLSGLQPSSPGTKPFRCNVCKIGYGQGATLDIHLRSVAHQSRMAKLADLVANNEVDASKPVLEQPGGPQQKTIAELIAKEEEMPPTSQQQQNVMNMFNLMNMLNWQNPVAALANFQNNSNTPAAQSSADSPVSEDESSTPKSATQLLNMLRNFGLDRLTSVSPDMLLKFARLPVIPDDAIPALCRVDCAECGETVGSLTVLSTHYQDSHSAVVPDAIVKQFCDRLTTAINDHSPSNGHSSPAATSREASRDDSEPPEKRPRSEPTPPEKPDMPQMAMLNLMGAGFPFMSMGANPMAGFQLQNIQDFLPLMAQQLQMGQSPAKRARTRISDDQLKILRQYFDINNSPSEAQIKEMSIKAGLPEKVIKHWFRNTLFKERQRDKDSPYNFSVPPQVGIDLDMYEKTGEAKVVPLTNQEVKTEVKTEPQAEKRPEPPSLANLPTAMNLQAMMLQQAVNPFQFMDQSLMSSQLGQLPPTTSTPTGRRANRTRFTDFQLRTLQQFFDKQAYPKDDDLELLSKKLQLSPRVIVVWFQNARQKARKIYENQPNHENNDRFLRTPGCNFQCKRCNLVFQRYYELIQHQQKVCYKDDGLALANDNKAVEENLTEDEKQALAQQQQQQQQQQTATVTVDVKPTANDLLKLLSGGTSTEALLKMCESANQPSTSAPTPTPFSKRCPLCSLLFKNKQVMIDHLNSRHAQQTMFSPVDVDRLPTAEETPTSASEQRDFGSLSGGALDLSGSGGDRESLSMSPFMTTHSEGDDIGEFGDDLSFSCLLPGAVQPGASRSPANNKRYRTHLTPMQVHVMKCIFADYKTPSMNECESLGLDIGLHKRVVQVWFQNARAKERKTRACNGEDEVFRSTATNCQHCGVEYNGRLTMQDHLFSAAHIAILKTEARVENPDQPPFPGENGLKPLSRSNKPTSIPSALNTMGLNGFPFNLMNGLVPGALPMMLDHSAFGVPVAVLQIPESVKEQIKSDMAAGELSTRFTHDGETVDAFRSTIPEDEASCLTAEDVEVGWGCPTCSNVFQAESHLKTHRQFCSGTQTFTLIQTHYACSRCDQKFGSRRDFSAHCQSAEHMNKQTAPAPILTTSAC